VCRIAIDPNHFDGDSMRGMSWFQEATAKEFTSDGFFRCFLGLQVVMAWQKWDEAWFKNYLYTILGWMSGSMVD